jgi:hypothetical protein
MSLKKTTPGNIRRRRDIKIAGSDCSTGWYVPDPVSLHVMIGATLGQRTVDHLMATAATTHVIATAQPIAPAAPPNFLAT